MPATIHNNYSFNNTLSLMRVYGDFLKHNPKREGNV
jgi:hypothetical protein